MLGRLKRIVTNGRHVIQRVHFSGVTLAVAVVTFMVIVGLIVWSTNLLDYLRTPGAVDWTFVGVAVIAGALQYTGFAIQLTGAADRRLPFARTNELEWAEAFTFVVTPESVGSIALSMRYLTKRGFSTADASGACGLSSFLTTAIAGVCLAVAAGIAAATLDVQALKQDVPSSLWEIIAVALGAAVIATCAVKLPRFRSWAANWSKQAGRYVRTVIEHPTRALIITSGELVSLGAQTACLCLLLVAVHAPVNVAAAVVITQLAGTASSVVPVPGGLGAPEAILVAGLVGIGVEHQAAVTAALMYRMITYWLPPILGLVACYDLHRRSVI